MTNKTHEKVDHSQPKVGEQYSWPGWDKKTLGEPPTIRLTGEPGSPPSEVGAPPTKEDVAALNKVLENMAKVAIHAKSDGQDTWKGNMKELSGLTIDVYPHNQKIAPLSERQESGNVAMKDGRAGINQGPVTIETTHGPIIAINPHTWIRYPVEGKSGEFAYAAPEQLLMHESRHYVADYAKHKLATDTGLKVTTDKNGTLTYDSGDKEIDAFTASRLPTLFEQYQQKTGEQYVVNATNMAMKSLDPNFKPVAFGVAGGSLLLEEKNGLPKVDATEKNAVQEAAKLSGRVAEKRSELDFNGQEYVFTSTDKLKFLSQSFLAHGTTNQEVMRQNIHLDYRMADAYLALDVVVKNNALDHSRTQQERDVLNSAAIQTIANNIQRGDFPKVEIVESTAGIQASRTG